MARINSDASLKLAGEMYRLAGESWNRLERAGIRNADGVIVVSRQKLIALRIKETGK